VLRSGAVGQILRRQLRESTLALGRCFRDGEF
jgi:hypothetical protein